MKNKRRNRTVLCNFFLRASIVMFCLFISENLLFAAEGDPGAIYSEWIWMASVFVSGALISGAAVYSYLRRIHSTGIRNGKTNETSVIKNSSVSITSGENQKADVCSECIHIIPNNNHLKTKKTPAGIQGSILIVEDDPVCLDMMVASLKSEKFEVYTADNGLDALEIMKETTPDLMLLDLVMPEKSGFDVCREIREEYSSSQLPVIMLTVRNRMSDLLKGFELGANDYLVKPVTNTELIARVKTHITIRRSDQALRESEEKYRQFFENVFDFWFIHDFEGNLIETNFDSKKQWRHPEEKGKPYNIKQLVPNAYRKKIKNYLRQIIQNEHAEGIVRCVTTDGIEKFMNYRSVLVKDDNRDPLYIRGSARDVTEQIMMKKEKNVLEKQIRQSQKMEAIGSLAGGIAHDFNNALFPIVGYTEMALTLIPDQNPVREYLEEVLQAATRASKMVDQIISFSHKNESAPCPLLIQPMLKECIKMLQSSLPSTIKIRHNVETHEDNVMADPVQIHQMLMNLCTNAYHAMGEEGELTIKLTPVSIDAVTQNRKAGSMEAGLYYHLSVSDTGCGISPELTDRIFEPYFTTKSQGKGTGIGLSVVHQIVKGMKGYIEVSTKTGVGTTFNIFLPRIQSAAGDVPPIDNENLPGGNEHILLVDDEQQIVKMMRKMIEPLGYDVTVRYSSLDALEAFRAAPDQYQLVLTDQTMPNMTGIMLCRQIRQIKPDTRLILCSGQNTPPPVQKPLMESIDGYIKKPAHRSQLAYMLRDVLDGNPVKPFGRTSPGGDIPGGIIH